MFCVEFSLCQMWSSCTAGAAKRAHLYFLWLVPASVQEGSLQPTGLGQSVSSVNQTSGWHVTRWTHRWREGPLVSDSVRV